MSLTAELVTISTRSVAQITSLQGNNAWRSPSERRVDDTLNLPGLLGSAVRVDLPRVAPSTKANFPLHIEVTIGSTRPSFFQGVVGVTQQRTGAMGVATTGSDFALPVSLPALDPTGCGSNKINGAPIVSRRVAKGI